MSVTVAGSNMMMRSQKTSGSAESGCGVCLAGFYIPNADVQERLKQTSNDQGPFDEIALHEAEGWTTFLGSTRGDHGELKGPRKIASYRRESHKFFEDLSAWFFRTKATKVHRLCISQSSGFISLTILYSDDIARV